jgi:Tol biopolymer transport system component
MSDLGTILEREMEEIRPAGFTIADVAVRRDRRRRDQRLGTALLVLVIAVAVVGGLLEAFGHFRSKVPVEPGLVLNGRIAFVSPGGSGPDDRIYTVAPDGSDLRQLLDMRAEYPAWSPDGSRVAFDDGSTIAIRDWSSADGHIYIVNADGTGLTRATGGEGAEFTPAWSPDGAHIAVAARGQDSSPPGIFVLDVATGQMHPITANPYSGYLDKEPDYSPDGTQIVFVRDRELVEAGASRDREALFIVNVDGSGLRRLTPWAEGVGTPSWSPDGSIVVFRRGIVGQPPDGLSQIFVIGADGRGGMRQLTFGSKASSFWPSWSPEGDRIIFTRWDFAFVDQGGGFELRSMHPDGSGTRPILQSDVGRNEASWGTHA